jgi:Xaa-Pro aminopeptidase
MNKGFEKMFFKKRFDRFRKLMDKNKLDAYLETKENNIFYLTGFKGSSYPMLFCKKFSYIFLSEMLVTQCSEILMQNGLDKDIQILVISPIKNDSFFPNIKDAIKYIKEKELIKTFFSPTCNMSFNFYKILENIVILKDFFSIIDNMRMIKDDLEIAKIRKACHETYLISQKIPKLIEQGNSEFDVAKKIDILSITACGEKAFDTIVSFGENTVFPHYIPSKNVIYGHENKEVMVDFCTKFEDYCSDMTRMFFVEGSKNIRFKEIFKIVQDAQEKAIDMVRAGVATKNIDLNIREIFSKFELDRYFIHGTGHGVGLDIHEAPSVTKKDETVLKTGMIITIEPGIYLSGIGGVRIEDTVLVTDQGCEILTRGKTGL